MSLHWLHSSQWDTTGPHSALTTELTERNKLETFLLATEVPKTVLRVVSFTVCVQYTTTVKENIETVTFEQPQKENITVNYPQRTSTRFVFSVLGQGGLSSLFEPYQRVWRLCFS